MLSKQSIYCQASRDLDLLPVQVSHKQPQQQPQPKKVEKICVENER